MGLWTEGCSPPHRPGDRGGTAGGPQREAGVTPALFRGHRFDGPGFNVTTRDLPSWEALAVCGPRTDPGPVVWLEPRSLLLDLSHEEWRLAAPSGAGGAGTYDVLLCSPWKGKWMPSLWSCGCCFQPWASASHLQGERGRPGGRAVGAAEEAKLGRTAPLPSRGSRTQTASALLWSGRPTWAPPCPAHRALEPAGAPNPERPHRWNEDGTGPYSPPASPESWVRAGEHDRLTGQAPNARGSCSGGALNG